MSKKRFTTETKLLAMQYLEEEQHTMAEICRMFSVSKTPLYIWYIKFVNHGAIALTRPDRNKSYSKKHKQGAIDDYLSGQYTMLEVLSKYEISDLSVFKKWLKIYTSHSELKDSGKGMSRAMTKGRKTTFEERIEIAKACLTNGKNYQETATQYKVSYLQVYQWVKKYEEHGEQGLEDRRGRIKPMEELTPEQELRLKIQQIERENERLRAENLFLKKLEEIERRDR